MTRSSFYYLVQNMWRASRLYKCSLSSTSSSHGHLSKVSRKNKLRYSFRFTLLPDVGSTIMLPFQRCTCDVADAPWRRVTFVTAQPFVTTVHLLRTRHNQRLEAQPRYIIVSSHLQSSIDTIPTQHCKISRLRLPWCV